MITTEDINSMLKEWAKTPEGRKAFSSVNVSKDRMRLISGDLVSALYTAGERVVKKGKPLFGVRANDNWTVRVYQKEGKAKLIFDKDLLHRDSFAQLDKSGQKTIGYTGDEVYDIVGLFTQGYTAKSFMSGFGETQDIYASSHSLGVAPGLKANPFIDNAVDAFMSKYQSEVSDVIYPSLWHSK